MVPTGRFVTHYTVTVMAVHDVTPVRQEIPTRGVAGMTRVRTAPKTARHHTASAITLAREMGAEVCATAEVAAPVGAATEMAASVAHAPVDGSATAGDSVTRGRCSICAGCSGEAQNAEGGRERDEAGTHGSVSCAEGAARAIKHYTPRSRVAQKSAAREAIPIRRPVRCLSRPESTGTGRTDDGWNVLQEIFKTWRLLGGPRELEAEATVRDDTVSLDPEPRRVPGRALASVAAARATLSDASETLHQKVLPEVPPLRRVWGPTAKATPAQWVLPARRHREHYVW